MTTVFIGSYTQEITPEFGGHGEGIYICEFDEYTGNLTKKDSLFITNPGYLTLSSDKKFLYSFTEVSKHENPKVIAYKIKDNRLTKISELNIDGGFPCHLLIHHNTLIVACYGTGSVSSFPLLQNGSFEGTSNTYFHKGFGPNILRQEAAHAHQIIVHPNKSDIYVTDLGTDQLHAYHFVGTSFKPNPNKNLQLPKGNGCRHMIFNKKGSLGYILNELTGKIHIIKNTPKGLQFLSSVESLPTTFKGIPSASAIRIHPNGKFLYTANRTIDCITIFKIIKEKLVLLETIYLSGKTIREFNLSNDGSWLLACMQDSDEIHTYEVKSNGLLVKRHTTKTIASPVCVNF
ncbi:lactonase family protein [Flavicella marina]|uniref:lactonase family protein n=1 Tax=Flavicella marina TaxID=1475951 RepID=UPI00126438DE|nr:lactonase family protein [Flavicella marina]